MGELPDAGDTDTVEIEAGGMAARNGVTFTCNSAYPCTVTVSNSLGTIIASWTSKALPDAVADVALVVADPPRDAMVVGGANRARPSVLKEAIDEENTVDIYVHFDVDDADSMGAVSPTGDDIETETVSKMVRSGSSGTFELQGDFVQAVAEMDEPIIKSSATDSDGGPTLMAGSDGLGISSAALAMWRVHSLERDWAHRLPDEPADAPLYGGFVTNAIVGEDIGVDKTRAFEDLFLLTTVGTGDDAEEQLQNVLGDPASNGTNAMFTYDGQADTYQNGKDGNEDFRGSFANVPGIYRCPTRWIAGHSEGQDDRHGKRTSGRHNRHLMDDVC